MTKRIASILFAALMLGGLLAGCGGNAAQSPAASAAPTSAPATPELTAEPTPTPDPEAVWAQAGKDTMAWLQSQPGFEGLDLTVQEGFPYFLAVNRDANTVTVYTADENGQYTKPYMAMVCSGGTDTPTGYWNTPVNYDWRLLSGPCYGQYATRINGPYLFTGALLHPAQGRSGIRRIQQAGDHRVAGMHPAGGGGCALDLHKLPHRHPGGHL